MSSIIKTHVKQEDIFKDPRFIELEKEIEESFKQDCWYFHDLKVAEQLRELIKLPINDEILVGIVRPWIRANHLARIIENMDIPQEKSEAEAIIDAIEKTKKFLNINIPARDKIRFLAENKQLDYEAARKTLDEIIDHAKFFHELGFQHGDALSPDYLRKYAIYSLFYIGQRLKIKKIGSPCPLYKFVCVITNLESKPIRIHYKAYEKISIHEEVKKSRLLRYIFDPT